jgi:hypothetical protein
MHRCIAHNSRQYDYAANFEWSTHQRTYLPSARSEAYSLFCVVTFFLKRTDVSITLTRPVPNALAFFHLLDFSPVGESL